MNIKQKIFQNISGIEILIEKINVCKSYGTFCKQATEDFQEEVNRNFFNELGGPYREMIKNFHNELTECRKEYVDTMKRYKRKKKELEFLKETEHKQFKEEVGWIN